MKISKFSSGRLSPLETPSESPKKMKNFRSILTTTKSISADSKKQGVNYQDFRIIKRIDKGKCMVFLANSKNNTKKYALKVFPSSDPKKTCNFYRNEIRFRDLKHKNVIEMIGYQNSMDMILDGKKARASYIVMEYAPYKDFCQVIIDNNNIFIDDEVLVRTYFHQLFEGVEYLHSQGVYHLDIKLDNLLMGEGYQLKIADFDNSHVLGDKAIHSKGTKYYRAPEIVAGSCIDPAAADIYSAGVVLFTMKTGGYFPHREDDLIAGVNFYELFCDNQIDFWVQHCLMLQKDNKFFNPEFRKLIAAMIETDPANRATIDDVKSSKWFNGPVYSSEELSEIMDRKYQRPMSLAEIK